MTADEIAKLPYRPCAGVMLVNNVGKVFVGQRIDNPGPAWQMPQGGIDEGEDVTAAALRELTEETGVSAEQVDIVAQTRDWVTYDLPHDLVPKLWKGRFRGQKQIWFLMRFNGSDADIRIEGKHQEFSRWKWMAPDLLLDNIVPFKRSVYKDVLAEFSPHL